MPDPIVPERAPGSAMADGAKAVGSFVKNAAVSVVEGVEHDGATLVGKDVTIGARVEAGLNIAADVASVVTGPEDIAVERGAVFAVKEGIEHAPQIAEGAAALGKAAVREAPEIAKSATVVFDKTAEMLRAAGHEIVDSQAGRGILETKHAIYAIAEGSEAHLGQVGELFHNAFEQGKNFVLHGPNLGNAAANEFEKLGYETFAKEKGITSLLTRSENGLEHALGDLEKSHALGHGVTKAKELVKGVTEAFETTGKVGEMAKKGMELIGYGATATVVAEHASHALHEAVDATKSGLKHAEAAVATGVHHAETTLSAGVHHAEERAAAGLAHLGHEASTLSHETRDEATHLAASLGKGVGAAVDALGDVAHGVADTVKAWHPTMPFDEFAGLMNRVRGGQPAPAHETAPARARTQHQGVER